MMACYEKRIEVREEDLDELQHVNNVRYVQWIQDISKEHWEKNVSPEVFKQAIWVVQNHNITYKGNAQLGDMISLKTYIAETRGATSHRVVEMRNEKTGELLVKSTTTWCLLHPGTFRPMRISREISAIFEA
ncbi:MAG TPA: thioesterase family protein [Eudoraea sp.]|nr:thioesterase family protein [Eudoraea sp.]